MRASHLCVFFGIPGLTLGLQSADDWVDSVDDFPAFRSLPSTCAQECIRNVHTLSNCRSYGCVCSENDAHGTNLLASYDGVSSCVEESCGGGALLAQARTVFQVICAAAVNNATSSTATTSPPPALTTVLSADGTTKTVTLVSPSTARGSGVAVPTGTCASYSFNRPSSFSDLPGCSRFVFTGCRDGFGNRDISDLSCGPIEKPDGWDSYAGLKDFQGACEAFYLCAGAFFYLSLGQLFNQSAVFCRYKPSVNGSVDAEWDKVIGVMADFCENEKFPQSTYRYTFAGPGSSVGKSGDGDGNSNNGLGRGEIIGIAIGVVAIVVTIIVSAPATLATLKTYSMASKMHKEQIPAAAANPQVAQVAPLVAPRLAPPIAPGPTRPVLLDNNPFRVAGGRGP